MEQFSLEKYLENPSRKVVTRQGKSVRIICTDRRHTDSWPIVALENYGNGEFVIYANIDGRTDMCSENIHDLFFVDEEKELTEFESKLADLLVYNHPIDIKSAESIAKRKSKVLIELARKEIREEQQEKLGTIKMPIDVTEPYYIKGKQDTLKDLPKWKDVSGKNGAGTKDYKIVGYYLVKGNYAIYLEDLDKLPKE